MQYTMRWYGPDDGVSLTDIAQAGCSGVVTALHHIPVGEVWSDIEIKKRKAEIENCGLKWTVVESLPVHEDIKRRSGNYKKWIDNYKTSLQNLGANGVCVVTYNFMPVLDWLRTNLHFETSTGAALRFEWVAFVAFDLYILQRPNATNDYAEMDIRKAKQYFETLSEQERENLFSACMQGLPGSTKQFTRQEVLALLDEYAGITEIELQKNLFSFLNEIAPTVEKEGVKMAIHPDDPPFPILGLPRIMSNQQHVQAMYDAVPSASIGLCFCTGSFGARRSNDLLKMFQTFASRIYFLHLRSTQKDGQGNFFEADHLSGDADLYSIVDLAVKLELNENRTIPMRPDHGHQMKIDEQIKSFPGYSFVGRLKGLSEIRGMETAIKRMK